jgi:hypothetical protein
VSVTRSSPSVSEARYFLLNDRPATVADDCLDTHDAAVELASILLSSKQNSPFVLAVDGDWGVGKSSLLQQICQQLSHPQAARGDDSQVTCIQFNAWTAENSSVLKSLIATVLYQLDPNFVRRQAHRLMRHSGLLGLLRVAISVTAGFFGLSRAVNDVLADLTISAQSRMETRDTIQKILGNWLQKSGSGGSTERSLVIFVDDLDRCSSDTVVQMCEVIKLYLDMPGVIFVLGCDLYLLSRGVRRQEGARAGQEFTYLEKIVQVAYRIPAPTDAQTKRLIEKCATESGISDVIRDNDEIPRILADRTRRNPRRIKRIINSFILEYRLHPGWQRPELGIAKLVKLVLLYQVYPHFYEALVDSNSPDDLIAMFLDCAGIKGAPTESETWRKAVETYELSAASRSDAISQLIQKIPEDLHVLTEDRPLVSLLASLGGPDAYQAIRRQLLSNPLRSERGLNAVISGLQEEKAVQPPAPSKKTSRRKTPSSGTSQRDLQRGQALNRLTDQLQDQVRASEGAAAVEQAQWEALKLEADANNAAAESIAQAAQHKMQVNARIMQGFDQVLKEAAADS